MVMVRTGQTPTGYGSKCSPVGWSRPGTVSLLTEALSGKILMKKASSEANICSTQGGTGPEPSQTGL